MPIETGKAFALPDMQRALSKSKQLSSFQYSVALHCQISWFPNRTFSHELILPDHQTLRNIPTMLSPPNTVNRPKTIPQGCKKPLRRLIISYVPRLPTNRLHIPYSNLHKAQTRKVIIGESLLWLSVSISPIT